MPSTACRGGTYVLVIENPRSRTISAGKLGNAVYPAGYYLYVGSAFGPGGVHARIKRHFRKTKKRHWHIDSLTLAMTVLESWYCENERRLECHWNRLLTDVHDTFPVKGFGSSDCGCHSHLHYFKRRPDSLDFEKSVNQPIEILRE